MNSRTVSIIVLVRWFILVVITIELWILFRHVGFELCTFFFSFCFSQYSLPPHLPFPPSGPLLFINHLLLIFDSIRLDWIVFSVGIVLLLIFPSSVHIFFIMYCWWSCFVSLTIFPFFSPFLSSVRFSSVNRKKHIAWLFDWIGLDWMWLNCRFCCSSFFFPFPSSFFFSEPSGPLLVLISYIFIIWFDWIRLSFLLFFPLLLIFISSILFLLSEL